MTADVMDQFNTEAMKLAVLGVTVTVAAGDDGVSAYTDSGDNMCGYNSSSAVSSWPVSEGNAFENYIISYL